MDRLILIAPGSPITAHSRPDQGRRATLKDPYFVQILLSVFTGSLDEELLDQTMAWQPSLSSVVKIVSERTGIPEDVARRISRIVQLTFSFEYRFEELTHRRVGAPVTVVKARGDNYSFIEGAGARQMNVISLDHGHYDLLTGPGLDTLVHTLRPTVSGILPPNNEEEIMPHVTIEHFPHDLSEEARAYLADKISAVVARAFACDSSAISIATRSVPAHEWARLVYQPRIEGRAHELLKTPHYTN